MTLTSPELTSLTMLVSFQCSKPEVLSNGTLAQFCRVDRKKSQTILFSSTLHPYSPETPPCLKHRKCLFPPANPVSLVWEWRVTIWPGQSSRSSGIGRESSETCKQIISHMILKYNLWLVKYIINLVPRDVV